MLGIYLLCGVLILSANEEKGTRWMVEPAGVTVLTYQHRNMEEPSLFGINFFTELD